MTYTEGTISVCEIGYYMYMKFNLAHNVHTRRQEYLDVIVKLNGNGRQAKMHLMGNSDTFDDLYRTKCSYNNNFHYSNVN